MLRRGKGLPPLAPHPHPRVQPPHLRFAPDGCIDEVEHFAQNQKVSVASLRRCSPSARNGVQLPSGMLFSCSAWPESPAESPSACKADSEWRQWPILNVAQAHWESLGGISLGCRLYHARGAFLVGVVGAVMLAAPIHYFPYDRRERRKNDNAKTTDYLYKIPAWFSRRA